MNESAEGHLPVVKQEIGDVRVLLGPGVVGGLERELARIGRQRALLVTGRSLANGDVGRRVERALGRSHVGTFNGSRPHVPVESVQEAWEQARRVSADVVVALGGGSPIGTAKAVAVRTRSGPTDAVVVVAVPTTYSGSEMTPIFGTTDRGRKEVVRDPRTRPRLVLYDPELARDTPPELSASTGINAFAHCVEGLYSPSAGEEEHALALEGAQLLFSHLPLSVQDPRNVFHRYRLFEGSMKAGLVLARADMAIHHGLVHTLGGRFDLPHGLLNAVVLPHAMRFNRSVGGTVYRDLASSLDLPLKDLETVDIPEVVIEAVEEFIEGLGLPRRLRDLGVPREELPAVAEDALLSRAVQNNPRPVQGKGDVLGILEAAW